ncbi:MAG TPA: hypothetical protein VNA12_09150 [Mycobacteriales bacterium]|nr:hypothetical protein [Mycobacteriales bacterium]
MRMTRAIGPAMGALALGLAGAMIPAAPAAAAPYRPSCSSGVYAPQVCTFVLSTVVARFAAPGQWAIVTPVRPSVAAPPCAAGGAGWVEQYRGSARTVLEGRSVIGTVTLTLLGCPDEPPTVQASAAYSGTERRGFEHQAQRYPYRYVDLSVGPASPAPVGFRDSRNWGRYDGWMTHTGRGELFRRDTGMSARLHGQSDWCDTASSNGTCNYGGAYGDATAAIDSSISGRWARLQVALDSPARNEDSTRRVTSQPYSNGWKVTNVG